MESQSLDLVYVCMYIYTYNMDIYTYTIAGVKFSRVSFPCAGMDQCGVRPQYICIYKYIDVGIDIYNASIYIQLYRYRCK